MVSVNSDKGVNKWKSKIKQLLQLIIQCEFPCRQTARPTPNYTFLFIFFLNSLPCHPPAALKHTSLLPHQFLSSPSALLTPFKAAIYFHFYHFIHSPNDNINECITFGKRDEGGKERWIYVFPLTYSPPIRRRPRSVEPGIWKWSRSRWEGVPQAVQMTNE